MIVIMIPEFLISGHKKMFHPLQNETLIVLIIRFLYEHL